MYWITGTVMFLMIAAFCLAVATLVIGLFQGARQIVSGADPSPQAKSRAATRERRNKVAAIVFFAFVGVLCILMMAQDIILKPSL